MVTTRLGATPQWKTRAAAALAILAAAALSGAWLPPVGAAPVFAVAAPDKLTGFEKAYGAGPFNSLPAKRVSATCPSGKVVVGGTAWITHFVGGASVPTASIVLTGSFPNLEVTGRYSWVVRAAETPAGDPHQWAISVEAHCADRPVGYQLKSFSTDDSHTPKQTADPKCPTPLAALGGGARIRDAAYPQGIGLQVLRVDGAGGLLRSQAQEHPFDYPYEWGLTATVICSAKPSGYDVVDGPFDGPSSEVYQESRGACGHLDTVSVGGAIDSAAPGNATLQRIGYNYVGATEQVPTSYPWGDVLIRQVCADIEWE